MTRSPGFTATSTGQDFQDDGGRRTAVYDALAEHPDPLLREIGARPGRC